MRAAFATLAVGLLCVTPAVADVPVPTPPAQFYKAVSPEQMMEILKSSGATEVREIGTAERKTYVWAEAPVVGAVEVGFAECHEQPNPCGYILMSRYRNLRLTTAQMNQFNARGGFSYVFREKGSRDVMLAFPVAVRTGLSREYILSTFGLMQGLIEVFEDFLIDTLHYKPEQLYHHAE